MLRRMADPMPLRRLRCPSMCERAQANAIDGRCADLQDLGLDEGGQVKMPVSFHGSDQHRDQRLQALAANPVGCLPQRRQRLANRLVVETVAGARRIRCGDLLSTRIACLR